MVYPDRKLANEISPRYTFPILMNPNEIILTMYKARSLPRTVIVSPEGEIVLRMEEDIKASGQVQVILVLNMKRFICCSVTNVVRYPKCFSLAAQT